MRYLVSKTEAKSIKSRKEYIYDIFHIYTLQKDENEKFVSLYGFPFNHVDIFFIIGHDNEVYNYLKENITSINESIIVAVTCHAEWLKKFLESGKKIFVPKSNQAIVEKYDGSKWGFNFDITDSEINFYKNKSEDYVKRLEKTMTLLDDF